MFCFLLDVQYDDRLGGYLDGENVLLQLGILEFLRSYHVGVVEVVEIIGFLRGEDATSSSLGCKTLDVEVDRLVLIEADVGDGKYQATVGCLCC